MGAKRIYSDEERVARAKLASRRMNAGYKLGYTIADVTHDVEAPAELSERGDNRGLHSLGNGCNRVRAHFHKD